MKKKYDQKDLFLPHQPGDRMALEKKGRTFL